MMHQKAKRTLGCVGMGALCAIVAACAGGDTPRRDAEVIAAIEEFWGSGGSQTASSGAGGSGTGTSGSGNQGGSGTAGSGMGGSGMPVGGSGNGSAGAEGGGDCDGFQILVESCGQAGCHGPGATFSGFAEDEGAAQSFVDEPAIGACASDPGVIFDPANPGDSLVITKMVASTCGSPMPLGGAVPSADEIACIEEWIGSL